MTLDIKHVRHDSAAQRFGVAKATKAELNGKGASTSHNTPKDVAATNGLK